MSRSKYRVGRDVTYRPTDSEATTGGGSAGDEWAAKIVAVNADDTVNLCVFEADGTTLAKTDVSVGSAKGTFDFKAGPQAF